MAGLYIHIPFCTDKCFYCDFFSGNQLYLIDDYVDALILEMRLRKSYLLDKEINTIYFGGGTPSLLSDKQLAKILNEIFVIFKVQSDVEITIECNPENISALYVSQLVKVGINRVSLGVQFLNDVILAAYNRKHTNDLIFRALDVIEHSHIENLSVDIIFSVPGISDQFLLDSLMYLVKYDVKHFSAYNLTVAKNSKLYWKLNSGEFLENNENDFLRQYWIIYNYLISCGFSQYEVSNYARLGYVSKHNLAYWEQKPYLGMGVSAHSYNLHSRQWNQTNIKKYIRDLNRNYIDFRVEKLSEIDMYNEYVILKLRTYSGISISYIETNFSIELSEHFEICLNKLLKLDHFELMGSDLVIPRASDLLIADFLAKILMY
jgi:oxygen-independent coproporphyrinogen-3 oxidase